MHKKTAIIVASGTGNRMGSEIPKQFLLLKGKPVLWYTIRCFLDIENCDIVLALSTEGLKFWKNITEGLDFDRIKVVLGGETRFHSVKNALSSISDADERVIAVHDGVRPFVSRKIIETAFSTAEQKGSAVVCVDSKDSVRIISGESNSSIERSRIKLIQTPQVFKKKILKQAYSTDFSPNFTDDASVVEYSGYPIHLVEGSYSNIKITTPEDLILAETLLSDFG